MEEATTCRDDADCPYDKYCYYVSERCVEYMPCSRHFRQENQNRSRHPSQCGPCLPGYEPEILSTKEEAGLCKKITREDISGEHGKLNANTITYVAVGVAVTILIFVATFTGILFYKRRTSKRRANNQEQWNGLCVVGPSAPPMENSPFIGNGEGLSKVPFNNNNLKDKNQLVCAVPSKEPSWVRWDPNYENNLNDDNMNVLDQLHPAAEVPANDDNSETRSVQQLTIHEANGNVVEAEEEDLNNSVNAILVQRNNLPPSNATEENNSNCNDTSSASNTAQDNRERVHAINASINQSININLINII